MPKETDHALRVSTRHLYRQGDCNTHIIGGVLHAVDDIIVTLAQRLRQHDPQFKKVYDLQAARKRRYPKGT
ncbi:MAG: hypothetical protein UU56_C0030G0007 [Candidatus Curtissbacteria bacterium GW2011_GWA2_41_24]|uniref:Uncharacterized protein n=1 Tax=Candidatus Curtissbacteria bacterium GW2011_GWA2_41_24 TaxID=1618411 RepID=A0A0G0VP29_9BACT|nr:MAG: hypothetical protein UU56_C0030G0007 [Candidatus Curtissbacteria bacterium GW2011_GWA2_41_24]